MKSALTIFFLASAILQGYGQSEPQERRYEEAYNELKSMLEGAVPPSFKRAVFISENAYMDGTLDYDDYNRKIDFLVQVSRSTLNDGVLDYSESDFEEVEKQFAVFRVLKYPTPYVEKGENNSFNIYSTRPFTYDFEDTFGESDWTKMFVTKLLATHTGNCHSLPFLYKILAEELGTAAHLAMAPNHTYIKQWTEQTGWFNTELTSGQFPIDSWMMASGYIKLEAIQNRLYMDTLSAKQSIAVTLTDLVQGYQKKFGTNDDFALKSLNLALDYYPQYANALLLKAELMKSRYEDLMKDKGVKAPADLWHDPQARKHFQEMQDQYVHIYKLGYRQMPREMYLNWLMDLEERGTEEKLERYTFEAPQPFEEYGQKVKVSTLSKGKYQEFFDTDTVTQIGSVVLNRISGQISHFVKYDTMYSEATLEPDVISRWLSPDPLAEEFYSWSPYNFVQNNPIRYSDPDGRAPIDPNCPNCVADDQVLSLLYLNFIAARKNVANTIAGFIKAGSNVPFIVRNEFSVMTGEDGVPFLHESEPTITDKLSAAFFGVIDGTSLIPNNVTGFVAKSGAGPTLGSSLKNTIKGISNSIHEGKQGKHIFGHNNFQEGKSILSADPQELLDNLHSGNIKDATGISDTKVRVNFGNTIGTFVDESGNALETTIGIVHNSKNGAHIVPARPLKELE